MAVAVRDMANFKQLLNDAGMKLVLVDFHATWCGPCKVISPRVEQLAKDKSGVMVVLKVDVDECEDIAQEYNISSMPTFIFIRKMEVIHQFSGANVTTLESMVASFTKPISTPNS